MLSGVGLLAFVLSSSLWLWSACRDSDGRPPDPELERAAALGMPSGSRVYLVTLGGRGSEEHAVPTRIQAAPGDGVEFRTVDHRVHTLAFLPDSLSAEVRGFLERTGQLSSPPLVSRGSRFILVLEEAPSGRYVFSSEGHGGAAFGVVEVGLPTPADSSGGR